MVDTSILQDREIEGITATQSQDIDSSNQPTSAEQQRLSNAVSLLTLIQIAHASGVKIDRSLYPVKHYHVLGEGATFSVRFNHRTLIPGVEYEVVKISRQNFTADFAGSFNPTAARALLLELKVLGHRSIRGHPNVTKLKRLSWTIYSTEPWSVCPALVVEFSQFGTLADFEESGVEVPFVDRKNLALGVARGLETLHDNQILHGDVKAENVLVFSGVKEGEYVAKLSDFGCALVVEEYRHHDNSTPQFVRLPAVSPPWHAPEALNLLPLEHVFYTDVFSFGLLSWRIMLLQHPAKIFDLPLDKALNKEQFRQIVELPRLRFMIPHIIAKELDLQDVDEFFRLYSFFDITLNPTPERRDLFKAATLLYSNEPWKQWARANAQTLSATEIINATETPSPSEESTRSVIDSPSDLSGPCTLSKPWILSRAILGFYPLSGFDLPIAKSRDINPRILPLVNGALSILSNRFANRHGYLTSPELMVFRQVTWILCAHQLLGIGCVPSPEGGLESLKLSLMGPSPAYSWKGSCAYLSLCLALDVKIPASEVEHVCQMARSSVREYPFVLNRLMTFRQLNNGSRLAQVFGGNIAAFDASFPSTTESEELESEVCHGLGANNNMIEKLYDAVRHEDMERLRNILSLPGIDLNESDEHGDTALLHACRQGHSDIALYLLNKGGDAAIENRLGENGLHWLSSFPQGERAKIAAALHENGARLYPDDPEAVLKAPEIDEDAYITTGFVAGSPILRAVAFDDKISFKVLWDLLFSDARRRLIEPWFMMTLYYQPLKLAFILHLDSIAAALLENLMKLLPGFVSRYSNDSRDMLGAWMREVGCQFLLWDVLSVSYSMARMTLHGERWRVAQQLSLQLLIDYKVYIESPDHPKASLYALNTCITQGNDEALRYFLKETNFKDHVSDADDVLSGCTPIDSALDLHRLGAFKLLVEAGAELDLRKVTDSTHRLSEPGASYLHVCAANRLESLEFAETILAHGVPASITDKRGFSALGQAILRADFRLARLLIEHGADVNSRGDLGYRLLGILTDPGIDWQCDDQVESLNFLLSLEGRGKEVSFFVSEDDDTTALMKVAYYPNAGPQLSEILAMLLKKFPSPEQLNARSTRESKTAAIQAAIAASNVAAVRAFVKAGADLTIKDNSDASLLDLAVNQFYRAFQNSEDVKREFKDERLERCLEIISIISEAAPWPEMIERSIVLQRLLTKTKDLVGLMMQVPHFISERERMHEILSDMVGEEIHVFANNDLFTMAESRRQLDRILRPVFRVELRLVIVPKDKPSNLGSGATWANNFRSKEEALKRLPVLKDFPLATFNRLKQASLFECILESERRAPYDPEAPLGDSNFWKFARSGKKEDLVYDHRYVRYPESLLECWTSFINENVLTFENSDEKSMVMRFFRILQARARQQAEGIWPLSPYDPEFTKFHLQDVLSLDREVDAKDLLSGPGLSWCCRCMREKIGTIPLHLAEEIDEMMEEAKEEGRDGIDGLLEYYDRKTEEVQKMKDETEWERSVLESDPMSGEEPEPTQA